MRAFQRTYTPATGIAIAALGFGALIAGFLPGWPCVFNDDFGYYRSVVETLWRGRPWTDDFLGPWSLSLTTISALVFRTTRSFTLATVGLQVVAAMGSFYFAARLIQERMGSVRRAIVFATMLLLFPTLLWKQAEFTSLVVYLPALFAALWFVARRRWTAFLVAFAMAVASRQSAVAWLALPLVHAAGEYLRERRLSAQVIRPACVVFGGALWTVMMSRIANHTHAQRFVTDRVFANIDLAASSLHVAAAALAVLTAMGVAELARVATDGVSGDGANHSTVRRAGSLVVAVGLLLSVVGPAIGPIGYEHPLFDCAVGGYFLPACVVLGAAGWAAGVPRMPCAHAAAVVATLGLASLPGALWDYYLIDPVLIALFGVLTAERSATDAQPVPSRRPMRLVLGSVIGVGLLVGEGSIVVRFKRVLDERAATGVVLERGLRAALIRPADLTGAPFGLIGWHLFPYYLEHEGAASADLAGFSAYLGGRRAEVVIEPVRVGAAMPVLAPGAVSEIRGQGWFGRARYTLVVREDASPAKAVVDWSRYRLRRFPLTDKEWRECVSQGAN